MRSTATETLRKRQQCHDMKAEGATHRQIQAVMNVGRATVRDWLSRPRPTDEEVAALPVNKTDITGQVGFKSRFDPELFARLRAEAELQGAATNRVIGCAVMLYLDVTDRARSGGQEPVDVRGYRA
jgi:UDP-N-acetyl-D-mannosaminuronate dehydrogenase